MKSDYQVSEQKLGDKATERREIVQTRVSRKHTREVGSLTGEKLPSMEHTNKLALFEEAEDTDTAYSPANYCISWKPHFCTCLWQ